jgi:hypothetical protein
MSGLALCALAAAVGQARAFALRGDPMEPQPREAPQGKDELLAGTEKFAEGATDVTDVSLDRSMLGAIRGKDKDAANKLNFIVVHSYTYEKPGKYSMDDVEAYQKKLTRGDWNCFIHVRERKSGEATDICKRDIADDNHELVIITAEPKELTFVHLSGKMPLGDLQSLSQLGSLGMLMAIPPVPPVPPVPGVPAAPAAPAAGSASPTKLQKQDLPVSEAEREWIRLISVAAEIQPRVELAVQRAEFQVSRAQMQEVAALQQAAAPGLQQQEQGPEIAELDGLDRAWDEQAERGAREADRNADRNAEQEAGQADDKQRQGYSREFQEQMKEWQRHMPKLDSDALREQARQIQAQMKQWQSHQPQIDQDALREEARQMQEQMRTWQSQKPQVDGEALAHHSEQLQEQMKAWQSRMPKLDGKQMEAQMKQFQAQMKAWQDEMPKVEDGKLQEQLQQFDRQMKEWQSHRPATDKQLQEQMQQLQKQRQELDRSATSVERAA